MTTHRPGDTQIALAGASVAGIARAHDSGAGPGLLLLGGGISEGLGALAERFAEEGYSVLALDLPDGAGGGDVAAAAAALRDMPATEGGLACLAYGRDAAAACAGAAAVDALVVFDAVAAIADAVAGIPCPVVLQFAGDGADAAGLDALRARLDPANGSRLYVWPGARPGFTIPGHAAFDRRIAGLAMTRTLELVRRAVGPHYDYAALFAEHVRHEFETRDVDATMATMVDEPYVNHVATLAGGVGHDMLKRFYRYHFIHQNSRELFPTQVSITPGPDGVVLETVVRFRHEMVLDRYFPGIEPTGRIVELATLLVVKFRGDKVAHEHIYWDQASALKQIGVLDADGLPIAGAEAARKVLDETQPSNIFMQEAWATSEGKPV